MFNFKNDRPKKEGKKMQQTENKSGLKEDRVVLAVSLKRSQKVAIEQAAKADYMTMSTWAKRILLKAANNSKRKK